MGIQPLWFAPGKFEQIEALLREVLERSSTRPLVRAAASVIPSTPQPDAAIQNFRVAGDSIGLKPTDDQADLVALRGMTDALLEDRIAFFLGAHAHLGNLPLGDEFYERLAEKFECPALIGDRTAVAAFVTSRHGPEALWKEVKAMISHIPAGPSAVHRVLAALPAFLRATTGRTLPLWVLMTNWDTLMEEALTAAGERFHLLYYIGGTARQDHGLYAERSPDGSVRIIERPENLRSLDPASNVIVKLNGGLVHGGSFPESVLIETAHFERHAARIPECMPHYLRTALLRRSLLFLGHGLAESDVHALIKYSAPPDRAVKSWAVQLPPPDPVWRHSWQERSDNWRRWSLQVVPSDLRVFLATLHQHWSNHDGMRRS
jgi:hypothetical protein